MTIRTSEDLISNQTFRKLNQVNQALGRQDETLKKLPMMRSPYHDISFLMFYTCAQEEKQTILLNLNEVARETDHRFTQEELDNLNNAIEWGSLLENLNKYHSESGDDFLRMQVSSDLYRAIKAKGFIKDDKMISSLPEVSLKTEVCIDTKIYTKKVWLRSATRLKDYWQWTLSCPQHQYPCKDGLFFISQGEDEIERLKEALSTKEVGASFDKTFGAIHLKVTKCEKLCRDASTIQDTYALKVWHGGAEELQKTFERTSVDAGIFRAFVGITLDGASSPIEAVSVGLSGEAKFHENGMEATQAQNLDAGGGYVFAGESERGVYHQVEITVNQVYVYEPDGRLNIDLSVNNAEPGGGAAADQDECDGFTIQLNAKKYRNPQSPAHVSPSSSGKGACLKFFEKPVSNDVSRFGRDPDPYRHMIYLGETSATLLPRYRDTHIQDNALNQQAGGGAAAAAPLLGRQIVGEPIRPNCL